MRASKPEASFDERVARVWGGLGEIVQAADDPDMALADFFQVTPEQLRAWRAAEGRHRCPGTTTRGHGCRNHASAVIDYDPRAWLSREPVPCPAHTPSSAEAAAGTSALPAAAPRIDGRRAATKDDEPVLPR